MNPETLHQLETLFTTLKDSGMIENLGKAANEPGAQTALVYGAILVMGIFLFRIAVIDKLTARVITFHTDNQKTRQEITMQIKAVVDIFKENQTTSLQIVETLQKMQTMNSKRYHRTEEIYQVLTGRRRDEEALRYETPDLTRPTL